MRYEFKTAEGTTCCSTDRLEYLCASCAAALSRSAEAPDPYADGIAKLRAAQGIKLDSAADERNVAGMAAFRQQILQTIATSQLAAHSPATSRAHLMPPNSYQIAIDRLKENSR